MRNGAGMSPKIRQLAVLAALYRVHVTPGLFLHFRVNLRRVGAADSEHTYTEPDDQFYTGTGM